MPDNMEPQPRETGAIPNRTSPKKNLLIRGASFLAGTAALFSSAGCNNEATIDALPTPVLPAATSTLKIENPTPNITTPKPATATQESKPAPTATATVEATPTPAKIELPPVYDLAYTNEIKGPDITVIFGIERAAYKNPVGTLELSDKYLRQYAPDKYPNGMSQQEMIQRLNDGVLEGHLVYLHQKPQYKDLTLQQLKDLIHNGQAPEYSMPTGYPNDRINIDTSKPISFILISHPGKTLLSTTISFDYNERNGGLIIGAYDAGGLAIGNSEIYHRESFNASQAFAIGLVLPAVTALSGANDLNRFNTDITKDIANITSNIIPSKNGDNWASIIAPGT